MPQCIQPTAKVEKTRAGGTVGESDEMRSIIVVLKKLGVTKVKFLLGMFFLHLAPNLDAVLCLRTIEVSRQSRDRLYSTCFVCVSDQSKVVLGVMTQVLEFTTSGGHATGNMQESRLPRGGCFVVFVVVFALKHIYILLKHTAHPNSVVILNPR